MWIRWVLVYCCCWFCAAPLWAQSSFDLHNGHTATEPVVVYSRFLQLSRQHPGLSQATALTQDQQGFLWIGTQHGLYRYDGQEIEAFRANPGDNNSLSADWISSLLVDRRGQIWIGTRYGGLNLFDPATETFSRIQLPRGNGVAQQVEISALYQDGQHEIWVGTYGAGLFRWQVEKKELESVQLPGVASEIDGLYINTLFRDLDGYLWIGTGNAPLRSRGQSKGGALRWHPQRLDKQLFSVQNSALTAAAVTAIKTDPAGQIWLSSYGGGLYHYQPSSAKLKAVQAQPKDLAAGLITDFGFSADGALWVSSYDQGLWLLPAEKQQWQQFKANPMVPYQLQSNNLTGLLLDVQGSLWLKSPAGLFALSAMAQKVRSLPSDPSNPKLLAHNDVFAITAAPEGKYWLANRDGGVAEFDPATASVQRWPILVAADLKRKPTLARHVLQDPAGVIWIGTDVGLFQLDRQSGQWQPYPLTAEPEQPNIGVLYLDGLKQLWVGTRGDGLFLLKPGDIRHYRQDPASDTGLGSNTISTLQSDSYHDLWIGYADQGISRLQHKTGKIQSWREGDGKGAGLRFNGIQLIYQEAGELWVRAGNINHRVLRDNNNPDIIEGFKSYLGAEDADIKLRQAFHFLWLYRNSLQQDLVQFGEAHGFMATTWIGSWLINKEGMHLRGGNQGLDYYQPALMPAPPQPLVARLTGFNLFNKKVRPQNSADAVLQRAIGYAEQIRLDYEQDMFTLQFSALDYVQPQQTRYRYRLIGFDRDWIETDANSRRATYTRLAPNDYQFEVMAKSPGQDWQQATVSKVQIRILPPWWLTWYSKLAALLLLFGSIWLFLQYRLRNERKTRNWLEQVVSSRTLELQTQNQALADSYRDMTLLQMLVKQITASLDLQEILFLCHQSLNEIMDVHVLAIGIYRAERQSLDFSHWLENGRLMAPFELKLQPELHLASVCFNQQREMNIQKRQEFLNFLAEIPQPLMGEPMQSVLYLPLIVNGEKIGCLTLQSPVMEAFSPQQINLVRTLASNIAIAVANANIVARLQQTQQQLVMQEKMASLGGLVAGVAHEVNTPLGICVTAVSHLHSELNVVNKAHQQQQLGMLAFSRFLETASATVEILSNNIQRAAQLINSFKQVAVDKSASSAREFDLTAYLQDVMASLQPELNRCHCQWQIEAEKGLTLYADAGSLAQLLTHLVMNSLQHGFTEAMQLPPNIELKLSRQGGQIQFDYRDNGVGMDSDTLKRLFDPFFTTKRSAGNSGLGAHIVYNLVTAQLGGSIYVSSETGQGVYYRILLPLQRRPE